MPSADANQILTQTREHARRLCDMLERQEADLASNGSIDPLVRDAGLTAVRRAIESARRLAVRAEDAVGRHNSDADAEE